jgi:hypothetical protein
LIHPDGPILFGAAVAAVKVAQQGVWIELRAGLEVAIVWAMTAARRKIRPEDIHGLKHFKALRSLIERLHLGGTQRDKAGNRELHMDQYCSLLLLWFLAPASTASAGG